MTLPIEDDMLRRSKAIVFILSCLFIVGCAGTQTKQSDTDELQQFYVIDVDRGLREHDRSEGRTLYLPPVKVTSQFRAKHIVFRVGDYTFQPQPSHQFFDTPEEMLTTQLQRWLQKTGLFHTVTTHNTQHADYTLESAVTGLYGDKIAGQPTKSIIEMQFFLIDNAAKQEEVVFQTGLHIDINILETTPSQVVKGWQTGLKKVLSTLEDDLSNYFVSD